MSRRCPDCGCRLEGGICSNCQEELFIITYQGEDMVEGSPSKEFTEKAQEQQEYIRRRDSEGKSVVQ